MKNKVIRARFVKLKTGQNQKPSLSPTTSQHNYYLANFTCRALIHKEHSTINIS